MNDHAYIIVFIIVHKSLAKKIRETHQGKKTMPYTFCRIMNTFLFKINKFYLDVQNDFCLMHVESNL